MHFHVCSLGCTNISKTFLQKNIICSAFSWHRHLFLVFGLCWGKRATILEVVLLGFWSPFLDLGAWSPIFCHLKRGTFDKSALFQVTKNGTSSAKICKCKCKCPFSSEKKSLFGDAFFGPWKRAPLAKVHFFRCQKMALQAPKSKNGLQKPRETPPKMVR